jgi:hypothetical protein
VRDRDFLRLVRDALEATNEFHEVTTRGLPEDAGGSAESLKLAALSLAGFTEQTWFNGGAGVPQYREVQFTLTVLVRDPDPDACADEADRLGAVAADAVNGRSLGGLTFTDKTRLTGGKYLPSATPEVRLQIAGTFAYDLADYTGHDTTSTGVFP